MRYWKLSKSDIALIAIAALIGGPGTARVFLNLANQYLKKYLGSRYHHDFELENFRNILSRLHRDKLVTSAGKGFWQITKKGREQASLLNKHKVYEEFREKYKGKKPDTIVVFDVPELNRKKREYLRLELLSLGYAPVQKSVLIGHSPLPREFLDYIREMKLSSYIQIFSIREYGTLA